MGIHFHSFPEPLSLGRLNLKIDRQQAMANVPDWYIEFLVETLSENSPFWAFYQDKIKDIPTDSPLFKITPAVGLYAAREWPLQDFATPIRAINPHILSLLNTLQAEEYPVIIVARNAFPAAIPAFLKQQKQYSHLADIKSVSFLSTHTNTKCRHIGEAGSKRFFSREVKDNQIIFLDPSRACVEEATNLHMRAFQTPRASGTSLMTGEQYRIINFVLTNKSDIENPRVGPPAPLLHRASPAA